MKVLVTQELTRKANGSASLRTRSVPVTEGITRATRESSQLVDGDELVAALLERRNRAFECGNGVRAIAAAVVHENDRTGSRGRQRSCFDFGRGALRAPVIAVFGRQHDEVATACGPSPCVESVLSHRVGLTRIGRTKQERVATAGCSQSDLGESQLELGLPHRCGQEVDVCERVVADVVALAKRAANKFGIAGHVTADDEERRVDVVALQHVEHLRCPLRIRSVVERERDGLWWDRQGAGIRL